MSRAGVPSVVVGTGRFVDRGGRDRFEHIGEAIRRALLLAGSSVGSGELRSRVSASVVVGADGFAAVPVAAGFRVVQRARFF